jgi:hypothetical protein
MLIAVKSRTDALRGATLRRIQPTVVLLAVILASSSSLPARTGRLAAPETASADVTPAAIPAAPMGWNSWNSFSNLIDAKIAMQQAKALVDGGMKAAGYEYVVIDEGWWKGTRDGEGNITVDPVQWPALKSGERAGDMANIAVYIHGLGLKAGIYTDVGKYGCGYAGPDIGPKFLGTGSEGHYERDFEQFAKWGFDYVKVDWCGGSDEKLIGSVQYAEIARAIQRAESVTGRRLYFSICEWGSQRPWNWAPGVGGSAANIWRTGGDIVEPVVEQAQDEAHLKRIVTLKNVLNAFDAGVHPDAQHTGYYNDLDMMVVGMRGMTEPWERIHVGLWALSSAPLMVGADLTHLKAPSLALLTNRELLAVHHDPLGLQAINVAEPQPGLQVWAKPLADPGKRAVVLLNRTDTAALIAVDWARLGLAAGPVRVRDVLAGRDLGSHESFFSAPIPAQDLVMLVVSGRSAPAMLYGTTAADNERIGGAVAEPCGNCPAGQSVKIGGNMALSFRNIKSAGTQAIVRVMYRNRSRTAVVARLAVNGDQTTGVAFPPTGDQSRAVALLLTLRGGDQPNVLEFSAPCGGVVALEGLAVSAW